MCYNFTTFLLLLLLLSATSNVFVTCRKELEVVMKMAREAMLQAMARAEGLKTLDRPGPDSGSLRDCVKLYKEAEPRLARLVSGLGENGWLFEARRAQNLTSLIREALAFYGPKRIRRAKGKGLLASWNPATSKADFVVPQDGSAGTYRTINEAVARLGQNRPERVVVYVKSGVYKEKVEIGSYLKNVMFVGDGMDKTIVTGNQNVEDGATTMNSATFGISGDGFWARDMTFENTAGPQKHQAAALRVTSNLSVFYWCSFKGYQDTLLVHSLRQFYRDCQIYGTVDFIFGDAAAVLQNCDIIVRKPRDHQSNMLTAQGRDDPNENTMISILNSRVLLADDFRDVSGSFESYLGRPWKKYSRTVFIKTDLDALVDGRGWKEWSGDFALSTLYYAEYMSTGAGAYTGNRVKWPGFHMLSDAQEADGFTVRNFSSGDEWIPITGVPFWANL
ncbi:Pectinesterase [Handroanthus impetiginosus]|uniref:Pectinesterase n=1 Tax=Handroanthus impetiginosus TaxID=429701 RepID=A0A2G9GDA6_9LAMI|nr:Pectinesterase [Handroanthus impetiginosus]